MSDAPALRPLHPAECALIVIDIQEKLLPPIFEKDRLLRNAQLLIRLANILEIPIVATTQYAKGLGNTVAEIRDLLPSAAIDKNAFSCFGSDAFCAAMRNLAVPHSRASDAGVPHSGVPDARGVRAAGWQVSPGLGEVGKRNTVLLCGMESHICVTQTALGALREGYLVHVASDAVSSRTKWNWKVGLDRVRAAGAVISSTEMMIYELLQESGTEAFKEMLQFLRQK